MTEGSRRSMVEDLALIEPVLWGLWAPIGVDPRRRAELINDATADHLTVGDVFRARRAFERVLRAAIVEGNGPDVA